MTAPQTYNIWNLILNLKCPSKILIDSCEIDIIVHLAMLAAVEEEMLLGMNWEGKKPDWDNPPSVGLLVIQTGLRD